MQLNYTTWAVPENLTMRYVFLIGMILFGIPYLLGYRLTVLGAVLNFFWADWIFYHWYKTKLFAQEYLQEEERKKQWRRDNGEKEDEENN